MPIHALLQPTMSSDPEIILLFAHNGPVLRLHTYHSVPSPNHVSSRVSSRNQPLYSIMSTHVDLPTTSVSILPAVKAPPAWMPVNAVTAVLVLLIVLVLALGWQRERRQRLGQGVHVESSSRSLWEDTEHWRKKKRAKIRQAELISSALRLLREANGKNSKAHEELKKVTRIQFLC